MAPYKVELGGDCNGSHLCGYMLCTKDEISQALKACGACTSRDISKCKYCWDLTITPEDSKPFYASIYDYRDKPRTNQTVHEWHIGENRVA